MTRHIWQRRLIWHLVSFGKKINKCRKEITKIFLHQNVFFCFKNDDVLVPFPIPCVNSGSFCQIFFFWPSIWHAMIWKDLKEKLRKRLLCSKNRPIELLSQDGTFAVHAHISLFDLTTFWFALYDSLCFLIGQACYCCHRYGSILEILQNHWVVKTRKTWRHQLSWYWKRKSKSDNPPTAESCLLK